MYGLPTVHRRISLVGGTKTGYSVLNGMYVEGGLIPISADGLVRGVIWYHWNRRFAYSLKRVEMEIKQRKAIDTEHEKKANSGRQKP
jgi:hypothetical protein